MRAPLPPGFLRRADRLDAYLDRVVDGDNAADRFDPDLCAVVRRLHAAALPARTPTGLHPPAFVLVLLGAPATARRAGGITGGLRRGWARLQWATTVLLLMTLLGGTLALGSRTGTRQDDGLPVELYRVNLTGQRLIALDPLTLADTTAAASLLATPDLWATPGLPDGVWMATSWFGCDGAPRVLRIDFVRTNGSGAGIEPTIEIRDGRSGRELARVDESDAAYVTDVSDDCDRLVFVDGRAGRPGWIVYEATTGQRVAAVDLDDLTPISGVGRLDRTGRRLYFLVFGGGWDASAPSQSGSGPYPVRVAAIDLETGAVVASADLPGVLAGPWPAPAGSGIRGRINLGPTFGLSPDGITIAVVAGDAASVVLLDAVGLTVTGSIDLPGGDSATPDAGAQAITVNAEARAEFSPDGGSLYVSGYEVVEAADGTFVARHHPLRRLDLATGKVSVTNGEGANQLVASPDGRWLYALGTAAESSATCDGCPQTLRRLGAETLAVEAERTLPAGDWLVVLPRGR